MKNPWAVFAGLCSVVLGIVLFSVVFGGYSSFIRAQKRVDTAKGLLIDQSRNQLAEVEKLVNLPNSPRDAGQTLLETTDTAARVLNSMKESDSPLARGLILEYEAAQVRVNKALALFLQDAEPEAQILKQITKTQTAVFLTGRQYNKAARYFNTRTQVFPGFIIARIFGLDQIYFTEIPVESLNPLAGKEAVGAS